VSAPAWEIVPLSQAHDCSGFDCGEPKLDDYLKQLAGQHTKRNVSRVYVALGFDGRVAGFYTLSSAQLAFNDLPEKVRKGLSAHYQVPAVRLGRLAVDRCVQGRHLGEALLMNALYRCARTAQEIGIAVVVVDAKHERARDFYLRYDFLPLTNDRLKLALPIRTIIEMFRGW